MISKRRLRLIYVVLLLFSAAAVISLTLYALRQNINFYYTPHEILAAHPLPTHKVRLGGMVRINSVQHQDDLRVRFVVTDYQQDVVVEYSGVLPDLFREGQGVVALGRISTHTGDLKFMAEQILAKHDEKYMPPL